jgi:hypothetical protein
LFLHDIPAYQKFKVRNVNANRWLSAKSFKGLTRFITSKIVLSLFIRLLPTSNPRCTHERTSPDLATVAGGFSAAARVIGQSVVAAEVAEAVAHAGTGRIAGCAGVG